MRHVIAAAALAMLHGPAQAGEDFFEDLFAPYKQRIEGVTASAGDAKAVNAATHIIDPWPPYAAKRRIPGNGERMAGAVERYRDVKKIPETPEALGPEGITATGVGGDTAAGQ